MRKARIALARRLAIIMHTPCCDTVPSSNRRSRAALAGQEVEPSSRAERRPREGADDGADSVACGQFGRLRFQPSRSAPS
jgi:hypothetical protein